MDKLRKIGWTTATALVIANMIGTGVFTSLGFQLVETQNTWSILILWILGGIIAIAGAFSYAELGSYFKRSGGEYHYLSRIFHPVVGYLSGWVSLTVGFAAPIALAAMAMGSYLFTTINIDPKIMATVVIVTVSIIHSISISYSSRFQNIVTVFKVVLIAVFIIVGFVMTSDSNALDWSNTWQSELLMPVFAVSLVFVTYSYTGWNAAAYIVEEIKDVRTNLPRALIRGTLVVTVIYVLLQLTFLHHADLAQLTGELEIGQIVAENLFGITGGKIISIAIALFLVSGISAMVWVGPRVTKVMAEDHRLWYFLNHHNKSGIPVRAIWLQAGISLFMIWTGTFEQVLVYCGFILLLFGALAVLGTFFLDRRKEKLEYRNPTYPWLPAIFIIISILILVFLIYERPFESLLGLSNLLLGLVTYWVSIKMKKS